MGGFGFRVRVSGFGFRERRAHGLKGFRRGGFRVDVLDMTNVGWHRGRLIITMNNVVVTIIIIVIIEIYYCRSLNKNNSIISDAL